MTKNQRTALIAGSAILGVALIGVGAYQFLPKKQETWQRPPAASVQYIAQRGDDLSKVADTHGDVPTLMLAAFNDRALRTNFNEHCIGRNWPQRGRHFCSKKLNLARANTLVPGQTLRIPDASAIPADITQAVAKIGADEQVAILVDGDDPVLKQRLLDAAVQFNLAFTAQKKEPARIWVYTNQGMVEYHNEGQFWPFGTKFSGLTGAVRALETQAVDRFILVTNDELADPRLISGFETATPIVGYCINSVCQKGMTRFTKQVSKDLHQAGISFAVPYRTS